MKKWLLASLMLLVMVVVGCTATIYGVPQDRWDVMSEQERIAAMDAYHAHQAALQQRLHEQARQRAIAEEARRAQEAEAARLQQLQIDAIYRGEGTYGDLLRVTLYDGMLKFYGAHKPFHPISFKIAAGEAKAVPVVSQRGKRATLNVSYDGGNLLLDETPRSHRSRATSLVYDTAWERGKSYPNLFDEGPLELRGVTAKVEILGTPPRGRHARRRPQIIDVESPAPKAEKPQVIVIKEQPRPPKAPAVDTKEQQRHHEAPTFVAKERAEKPPVVVVKPHPAAPVVNKHPAEPRPVSARNQTEPVSPPARVTVAFQGGKIKSLGKAHRLVPQSIELKEGEVRSITLRGARGGVKIQVSYLGGEIQIDDRSGKKGHKTKLGYDPGWRSGRTYRVEDTDHNRLEGLDVLIIAK
ncbi:MAG TPA: hypothetical protein VJ995_07135 [Geothermobacteraceae bacterium]|nr:hypothetical protein [Geothermobacteraceae bacterium]